MSDKKRTRENTSDGSNKRPSIVEQSVLATIAQRDVSGRGSPVLNEPMVGLDVISDLENIVENGDLRKFVGLKQSSVIELKWEYEFEDKEDEVKWELATVHEYETGRTHRVYNVDNEEEKTDDTEYQDIPIVSIHYTNEKDVYHDICILGDHLVLDIEHDCPIVWRYYGDTYEDSSSDEEEEEDNTVLMMCENEDDLRAQIDVFVPKMFVSILEKYRSVVDKLPLEAQDAFTTGTLSFKDQLSEQIFKFFTKGGNMKEGDVMCLAREDVDRIIQNCLDELNK